MKEYKELYSHDSFYRQHPECIDYDERDYTEDELIGATEYMMANDIKYKYIDLDEMKVSVYIEGNMEHTLEIELSEEETLYETIDFIADEMYREFKYAGKLT